MNTNNPFAEVGIILVSVCLIVGGVVLLVLSKVVFTDAALMFTFAIGLFGVNSALKSPSPAQQTQLQQFMAQVLSTLPAVVSATQSQPAPQPPVMSVPLASVNSAAMSQPQAMPMQTQHIADEFTAPLQTMPKQ